MERIVVLMYVAADHSENLNTSVITAVRTVSSATME